ncbi:MFS transporter [Streptomyces sp. NBC_01433]|uniref:MFS transporter n=1 Tax=Streptomyces sp. NBC_01433 TaxID=2903864 RepID=UPI0022539C0F|nr:MFS transporter [Streptomyces sp. NBC_01433]MCX4675842.1 MFS transporter [Streptomyces sp. NBC_01433]
MSVSDKFGALAEHRFRLLWIGRTTSALGDALMPVTLVFAVLSAGGSAADIGLVIAATMVARTLLLLVGGALADRLPRRLLLGGSDLFLFVVQVAVGVLLLTGHGSVTMLLATAICYGAASAITKPAIAGLVPQTISKARLQQANSLMELSRGAVQVVGPGLAGATAAIASPGAVYLLDAATFLVSAVTLALLPLAPPARRSERTHIFAEIAAGWSEVVRRPWYWVTLCGHAVWNVGSSAFFVLGPVIVARQTGGAANWGLVSACMAVGALIGAAVGMRYRPRRPLITAHLALLATVPQLAALTVPSPTIVIMGAALVGATGVALLNILWDTAVQKLIPEDVLSRVSSYDWLISFTVAPLGYAAAGPLAEAIGEARTLELALAFVVAGVVAVLLVPRVRQLRQSGEGRFYGWPDLDHRAPDEHPSTVAATGEPR